MSSRKRRENLTNHLYEVEGGDVFVAYVFSYFLQRKTYEKLRLTARVILLVESHRAILSSWPMSFRLNDIGASMWF